MTSGSRISEDTPTQSPKRRKVNHPKPVESLAFPEILNAVPGTVAHMAEGSLNGRLPQKESRQLATTKETEVDVGDESSSEVDDMGLADFDTEGMTKEELKLWSRCAPMDQKLVLKNFEDSSVPKSALKVHFRGMQPQLPCYLTIRIADLPRKMRLVPRVRANLH